DLKRFEQEEEEALKRQAAAAEEAEGLVPLGLVQPGAGAVPLINLEADKQVIAPTAQDEEATTPPQMDLPQPPLDQLGGFLPEDAVEVQNAAIPSDADVRGTPKRGFEARNDLVAAPSTPQAACAVQPSPALLRSVILNSARKAKEAALS